jgi:hypothetical protein
VCRGQVDGREAAREDGKWVGRGPSPPRPSAVVPAGPDPSPAVLPPVWGVRARRVRIGSGRVVDVCAGVMWMGGRKRERMTSGLAGMVGFSFNRGGPCPASRPVLYRI